MSVNLRDRLFNDTGGVVQGATVQAILVTGGGTDAGTGSTVQSTTTTDVNGVWKFTTLPDPGAGNWYDVKIINGNQVRWRYGNIQAVIQSLLLQGTVWASPHFTSPVVDSGGLTVTAGGLTVTAGNVGIGTAPVANEAIHALGTSNFGRLRAAVGTVPGGGQFTLSGWGTGAAVSVVAGSTDQRGAVTITAGSGTSSSPTFTYTFVDGAWPLAPIAMVQMTGTSGAFFQCPIGVTTSTTTLVPQTFFTPTTGTTYTFAWVLLG